MSGALWLLTFVTLERGAELVWARMNTRRLLAKGAGETGAAHYPLIVGLHAAWLAGLWTLATAQPLEPVWLAVFVALQALRLWILATLGRRWTTRILIVPDETLVACGPYRLMRHPNYALVIAEIAVLPLCFGLWAYAGLFSALNAIVLTIRIRAEDAALAGARRNSIL